MQGIWISTKVQTSKSVDIFVRLCDNDVMTLLKEGDIVEIKEGHKVYADIPKHFLYANHSGDFTLDHGEATVGGDFSYLAGRYVVVKTTFSGGGTGHGPHDVFPDGHHVYCEKLIPPDLPSYEHHEHWKLDFYQTGCFTAMIEEDEIEVVGHAERRWEEAR